jgi:septum formation protein
MADCHEGDAALSPWERLAPWILASASPRRAELLQAAGLAFRIAAVAIDETPTPGEAPLALCERLAREKAAAAALLHPDASVLGGDTIVALGERVLGKPVDRDDARAMLTALSGKTHRVASGVALSCPGRPLESGAGSAGRVLISGVSVSEVQFETLDDAVLQAYLDGGEWEGKAGAYAIQGDAGAFVRLMSGDFDTVVGLPVAKVFELVDDVLASLSPC